MGGRNQQNPRVAQCSLSMYRLARRRVSIEPFANNGGRPTTVATQIRKFAVLRIRQTFARQCNLLKLCTAAPNQDDKNLEPARAVRETPTYRFAANDGDNTEEVLPDWPANQKPRTGRSCGPVETNTR